MTVSSLADRRAARAAEDAATVTSCRDCGGQWFRLHGPDGEAPAVALDAEGRITGYAGRLVCNDCERTHE